MIINNDLLLVLSTPASLKVYLDSPIELKVGIGWPKMKGFVEGF